MRKIRKILYWQTRRPISNLDKIPRFNLTEYLTFNAVAKLKHEYLDDSYVHRVLHHSAAGYFKGKLAFVYLKKVIPHSTVKQAFDGLESMRFAKGGSLRKAVGKSNYALSFGWRKAFGEIKRFAPTLKMKDKYKEIWPLIARMDGEFAKVIPLIWRNALLGQRSTDFRRSATKSATFSSIQLLKNAPTSIHLDPKNATDSMSVLTTCGKYTGGEFMFPAYGVSIPIQPGGVIIAATFREWHCNFKLVDGLRYSIIGYFSEKLRNT